jgi:protein OS-9
MTTTDIIYMVKELAICSYVLILHSPHLCSLPGFRAEHKAVEPAPIRCRQVISDEEFANRRRAEEDGMLGLPMG